MQEMSLQDMKEVNGGSVGGLLKEVGKWLLSSMAWDLVKEQKTAMSYAVQWEITWILVKMQVLDLSFDYDHCYFQISPQNT